MLKKYIAYIKQGKGCDYTIACGETVIEIDGDSWLEAKVNLAKRIMKDFSDEERQLKSVIFISIAQQEEINLDLLYATVKAEREREKEEQEKEIEKLEYEKLRLKFEK